MFLTGVLSLLQITFIPGFILLHLFSIKTNSRIQKYLYIFSLSLFFNYSIVTLLTVAGIYSIIALYIILVAEFIVLALLIKSKKVIFAFDFNFKNILINWLSFLKNSSRLNRYIFIGAGLILLFYFALFISNLGTIFYFVDTVNNIHWNTWAIDFANNMLPKKSSHFPQLVPANWSVAYVLTGNTFVNFFPKSFMPLFFFNILLMFLDLALWKRNSNFIIALIIYGLFALIFYPLVFIADGNGDLPVTFFTFFAFYVFLKMDKNKFETSERVLFFLFAASAAATKLAGFYIFTFASVISIYGLIKFFKKIKKSDLVFISLLVPFILGICLFWHFLKPEVMYSGLDQPEWVGENYWIIFTNAANLMYYNWGLPVLAFLVITILASLFHKEVRYITIVMVIPPTILWMLKYSADFRNLSFAVPFISYVSAFGLMKIIEVLKNKSLNQRFEFSPSSENKLMTKQIIWGSIISLACFGMFFLISSDPFYEVLLRIHKFISISYFHSRRINMLVDYTQYVSIDYYQNVLATMCLIIPVLYLLAISNLKLFPLVIMSCVAAVIINFSFITETTMIKHQQKEREQVDARNYAAWMSAIVESSGVQKQIYTNFKAISTEKVPGSLDFIFIQNDELNKIINDGNDKSTLFLKAKLIDSDLKKLILQKISEKDFQVLFDDGDFLLLTK